MKLSLNKGMKSNLENRVHCDVAESFLIDNWEIITNFKNTKLKIHFSTSHFGVHTDQRAFR